MKLKDIEVGKTYYVRIPRDVDEYLHVMDSGLRPRGWARQRINAEVLAIGVEREVIHRTSLGGIQGSPRVRSHETTTNDGVKIRFTDHHKERVVVVPPRSIQWEVEV
jgi:hypothetical protein